MYISFQPIEAETKKYEILRDYFVTTGKTQGIYFIVKEMGGTEIKKIFVDLEDVTSDYVPKKSTDGDVKLKAYGVESGEENVLILEHGLWTKKGLNKETEISAKRYRFILKRK